MNCTMPECELTVLVNYRKGWMPARCIAFVHTLRCASALTRLGISQRLLNLETSVGCVRVCGFSVGWRRCSALLAHAKTVQSDDFTKSQKNAHMCFVCFIDNIY